MKRKNDVSNKNIDELIIHVGEPPKHLRLDRGLIWLFFRGIRYAVYEDGEMWLYTEGEKGLERTITHETLHWVLDKEFSGEVSWQFDRVPSMLNTYCDLSDKTDEVENQHSYSLFNCPIFTISLTVVITVLILAICEKIKTFI